jgi:L-aminopeptidase/D-esterase-like protein
MMEPGSGNLITDVEGLRVGNAEDASALTGATVVVADGPMVAAADVRGGAPGTRETPALDPANIVESVHAVVLSGGSVFGFDAASSVTLELARRGVGFRFGDQPWPCPVVPAAVLFDLMNGGDKSWRNGMPYARLGREALAAVGDRFSLGNAGAGLGAIAGAVKGGLGSASAVSNGFTVGALVAVNSVGSCFDGATGLPWSIGLAVGEEMGPRATLAAPPARLAQTKLDFMPESAVAGANTTIAVVATDARLTKAEARRLAIMAADGLAVAIRPLHTPFDGDTLFATATGRRELPQARSLALARLGASAAAVLARSVGRALWEARSTGRAAAYRDLIGR